MERLLKFFVPKKYFIQLNINKQTEKVFGYTEIIGIPHHETIRLHAKNLKITKVELDGESVGFSLVNDELQISQSSAKEKSNRSEDLVKVSVHYTFSLNKNMQGCYLSSYEYVPEGKKEVRRERLVSTQFESHYARECFPCIDEPEAKATFDLKIITPDTDDIVVSNMPVRTERVVEYESVNPDADPKKGVNIDTKVKKKIVEFETTPRMSTYLLAFCLGRFHKRSKTNRHGVKITSYCALNQDPKSLIFANEIAADSLDYYDDKFGVKYPLPKLDQVAIPDFEAGAMENWGLVTYRESCMLAAPGESKTTKEYISTVIAHELSHQWFGNLVTMKWWDNLWLNESFANIMEYICVDAIRPSYHIWEYFYTGECRVAMQRDSLPGVQAVQQAVNDPAEIATLFDGAIVYAKGARLIYNLIRLMGEKEFFSGIKDYFKKFKYSNTTGDDLWAALQPYADFSVKEFMDSWIMQPGFPVITDGTQQRFLLIGTADDEKWVLPAVVDDMSGHYIINLSSEEFSDKLKSFAKMNTEQRIRLLMDRSLLSKTALVSSASHFELLGKFKKETSFAIWSTVVGLINDLKLFFSPLDSDFPLFQKYVFDLIQPQLRRLGLKQKPHEDDNETKLRSIMLGLSLYAENEEYTKKLADLYSDDLTQIDAEKRGLILMAKIREDDSLLDEFIKKYRETADPNIKDDLLAAITDVKNHTTRLLKLLDQHTIVRPQDHLYLFVDLLRNYKTKEKTINWLYEHWDEVVKMTGEKSVEDYPRLLAGAIRIVEEAKQYEEFFTPLADNPVLSRTISIAKADIDARLRLISMDYDDVHRRLLEIEK